MIRNLDLVLGCNEDDRITFTELSSVMSWLSVCFEFQECPVKEKFRINVDRWMVKANIFYLIDIDYSYLCQRSWGGYVDAPVCLFICLFVCEQLPDDNFSCGVMKLPGINCDINMWK